jgi:hypothetical protein
VSWRRFAALALLSFLLPSCAALNRVLGFEKQVLLAKQTARVSGRIDTEGPHEGPLVVVIARVPDVPERPLVAIDSFVRVRPGSYAFLVTAGRYQIGAYEDRNHNRLLDPGERTRAISEGSVLEVGTGESVVEDIVLAIDATSPPALTEPINVLDIVARTPKEQRNFSLWAWSIRGEVCEDLSVETFGRESGTRGLWEVDELAGRRAQHGRPGVARRHPRVLAGDRSLGPASVRWRSRRPGGATSLPRVPRAHPSSFRRPSRT